jgi:hypothetical protein
MSSRFLRNLSALDVEEKILNGSAAIAMLCVFFPWMSGEWLRSDTVGNSGYNFQTSFSGFEFFTSFLGLTIFLLQAFIIAITLVPLVGGPVIVRKRYRELVRTSVATITTVLVLAALSVLTKVTFEFSRMEMRFGIYLTLIASIVTLIYAVLRLLEQKRTEVQELFHHPEDSARPDTREEPVGPPPPPPPPPPALEPEEHRLYP